MSDYKKWIKVLDEIASEYKNDQRLQHSITYIKGVLSGGGEQISLPITSTHEMPLPGVLTKKNQVALFTDGACLGNPGPGAWAAFAQNIKGEVIFESTSFDGNTTNNKMEMQGVINGLLHLIDQGGGKDKTFEVFVYTDSKYVVDGVNQWMPNWKKNGWKKADQKTPENLTLWQQLDDLLSKDFFIKIHLNWVKGHAGHPQNEYCDRLCQNLLKQILG